MAIKTRQKAVIVTFILVSGLTVGILTMNFRFKPETEHMANIRPIGAPNTSSEEMLVDKVFTFLAPNDTKRFSDLNLLENLNYYVLLEIVTPHNCEINISIIDPELDTYDIFRTEVNISQGDQWFEVPFGTAISGNYTFIVSVITTQNLNVHIKIHFDKENKCLYDIIAPEYLNNLELYRVNKFTDETMLEHNVMLKTDVSYKFYLGRVSAIGGGPIDGEVRLDYDLTDPEDIEFIIYQNKTAESVGSILQFNFGTAVAGIYTVSVKIFCRVDVVNIAYAIAEDHSISTVDNGTTPDPIPSNGTTSGILYSATEWTIGFGIFIVGLLGFLVVIGSVRKRRNSVNLKYN